MFARVDATVWVSKFLPGGARLVDATGASQPFAEKWAHPGMVLEVSQEGFGEALSGHCTPMPHPTPKQSEPERPAPRASAAPLPPPVTTDAPDPVARPVRPLKARR